MILSTRKLTASAVESPEIVVVGAFDEENEKTWSLIESLEVMEEHEAEMWDMELDV